MAEPGAEDKERHIWHRRFAAECNNLTWDLIENTARSDADTERMLHAAHAATLHWSFAGTPLNVARAELTLSRAYALSGIRGPALFYAERFLRYCEANQVEDWDAAFAQVALAHAAALGRDAEAHRRYYAGAAKAITAIAADGDRQVVESDLARVPKP